MTNLTIENVKSYLKIDYTDEDNFIKELIQVADDYLDDAVDDYTIKSANEKFQRKASICLYAIIQELYDNRGLATAQKDEKVRKIISSFMTQLNYGTYE